MLDLEIAPSEATRSQQQLCLAGSQDLAPALPVCQRANRAWHPHVNNHGWGPQRRASAANELLGLVHGAVETLAP